MKNNKVFKFQNGNYYEKKKSLLGKLKLKLVNPSEVYLTNMKSLSENIFTPYPVVESISSLSFLSKKTEFLRRNNLSDFKNKVKCIFKTTERTEDEAVVKVLGNLEIYNENGNLMINSDNIEFIYIDSPELNITDEDIAVIFQNSFNGAKISFRDYEKHHNILTRLDNLPLVYCDECKKPFYSLDDFYCHLIEEKHNSKALDEFPYDREAIRVKNLIEK